MKILFSNFFILSFLILTVRGDACDEGSHTCTEKEDCHGILSGFLCLCKNGYGLIETNCEDIDECKNGDDNCHEDGFCTNTDGSFSCACKPGYFGSGTYCVDDDECFFDPCDNLANCTNTIGSFECVCNAPFWEGNGFVCEDKNECALGEHNCHDDACCTNIELGFTCECNEGFSGDGSECSDIDECADNMLNDCSLNSHCENTQGGYDCVCDLGYNFDDDLNCVNIDECDLSLNDCDPNADCFDLEGSFKCECIIGWQGDGVSCYDVNECYHNVYLNHTCIDTEICENTEGAFTCNPINCESIQNSAGVVCDHQGMTISFPKCVYENFTLFDFYMNGPNMAMPRNISENCYVQNAEDGDIWFDWIVNNDEQSCGTIVTNNGTHAIYENAVQKTIDYGSNSIITRGAGTLIHFSCSYKMEMELTLNTGINVQSTLAEVRLASKAGKMQLTAGLFKNQLFQDILNPMAVTIVPDEIYLGISMISWDTSFNIMLEKCWATPTSNPRHQLKYKFIDEFCGDYYEENIFNTLKIYQNGGATSAKFSLKSFTWNEKSSSKLYFHCLVAICDSTETSCIPDCSLRKKRSTSNKKFYQSKYLALGTAMVNK